MKIINYVLLGVFGFLLAYGALDLPLRGSVYAPANRDVSIVGTPGASAYYIRNAQKDMATPNVVTAILADYRGYDTLGETTVIFCAGIIVFLILRRHRHGEKD